MQSFFLDPLSSPLMASRKYESVTKLSGHSSSISAVAFSPDSEYLASGSDDGTILITASRSWEVVKKLVNVSPVTALMWYPTFPMMILCGFASGAVLTVYIGGDDHVRKILPICYLICSVKVSARRDPDRKCGQIRLTVPFTAFLWIRVRTALDEP